MRGTVLAILLCGYAVFSVWVYQEGTRHPEASLSEAARRGKQQFQNANCVACHQLFGLGGYMGPDLTLVTSRRSEAEIRWILQNGMGRMPNPGLDEAGSDDLIAYLRAVRAVSSVPRP